MTRLCDKCKEKEAVKFWVTGAFICDECYKEWEKRFEETRKIEINNKVTIFDW